MATTTTNNTDTTTAVPTPSTTTTSTPTTTQNTPPTTTSTPSFNSSSLYVGDIGNDVNETSLFEIFNAIGPVASIRVCRDAITRRSLGYAYVNFHNPQDADRALESLNNQPIKGKPCRIMWSQRDPSVRKSGKGNIFIKNLDKSIDHKALFDTFSQFGQILSCKIELDDTNNSKGYGYIQYMTQDGADKAVQKVNNMMLAGKKVFVGPFVPRKERSSSSSSKKFTNIYVNNLSESVSEEEVKKLFEAFGEIKSAVIMKDEGDKSKGFAFINYANPEDAAKAVDEMNGKDINGKPVFVGRAQKKAERESELRQKFELMKMEHMAKYQGVNLYVKNLDDDFDDTKVIQVFSQFGTITSAKIMKDSKGVSKGFGFVCFTSPEEATKAVTEMNGKIVGSKPLYVALAQRKDVRKLQLESQFSGRGKGLSGGPGNAPHRGGMGGPHMGGMGGMGVGPGMYNGAPVFYAQGGPGQSPFVFGNPNMMNRGRFPPGGPGPYQGMPPNYLVVGNNGGRGQAPVKNMGRGGNQGGNYGNRGRGGMKHPNSHHHHQNQNQNQQPIEPVVTMVPSTTQGPISMAEQKNLLGEKLYPLIHKVEPVLAGKITGMILDSSFVEEILSLIESPELLTEKVNEALKVLKEHQSTTATEETTAGSSSASSNTDTATSS